MTTISSQVKLTFAVSHIHSVPRESPREGNQQNQPKSAKPVNCKDCTHPSGPWTAPKDPGNYQQNQISISFQFPPPGNSTTPNYQQNQISISFQFPPPGSSTKPASASTTRQQHKIGISFQFPPPGSSTKPVSASSFHHQAAAPCQPASSKASSQSAVNSTMLHTHIMAARSVV